MSSATRASLLALLLLAACGYSSGSTRHAPTLPNGDQVLVVLIVSAESRSAGDASFRAAIAALRSRIPAEAERIGVSVSLVGVAIDWDVEAGLRLLDRLGPFDQVVAGGNWANLAIVSFVWRDFAGPAVIPQAVVLRRSVRSGQQTIEVTPDRLVARYVGTAEVETWIAGARHF